MLKILFCFNCCAAPSSSRPVRGTAAAVKSNEKLVEEANFKSLLALNEKDQLLANQIQANNDLNYGVTKDNNNQGNNKILLLTSPTQLSSPSQLSQLKDQLRSENDSLEASTSAPAQQSSFVSKLASATRIDRHSTLTSNEFNAAYRAGESLALSYDDGSISSPSSIDVDSFRDIPDAATAAAAVEALAASAFADQSQSNPQRAASVIGSTEATIMPANVSPAVAIQQKIITSTTKIGDYARLEYSPVEDLESVTTYSQSRGGSEMGGRQVSGANSMTTSRPSSSKNNTSANVSRRSSQGGFESTSISIASQLSNEQFQQNLTNMLESVNSPMPLFGTIGLPLGPPLESYATETAKTSPETTGAALTSASQDSLSGNSIGDESVPASSRAATMGSKSADGAALVNDSIEDSAEIVTGRHPTGVGTKARARLAEAEVGLDLGEPLSGQRIESSLSMATTTSGGLTNPTPTPSEMSGSSQSKQKKKKSKLRAGKLFKKLRRGGSKSEKSKDSADTENKDPQ